MNATNEATGPQQFLFPPRKRWRRTHTLVIKLTPPGRAPRLRHACHKRRQSLPVDWPLDDMNCFFNVKISRADANDKA